MRPMTRRVGLLLAVLTLIAAACANGGDTTTTTASSATTTTLVAATTTAPTGATATTEAAASLPNELVIGASLPFTGLLEGLAVAAYAGLDLAMDDLRADGVDVAVLSEDNGCNPTDGVNTTNLLIESGASVIVGPICSNVAAAALPIVERGEIPLLMAVASDSSLTETTTEDGNKWAFRSQPNDVMYAAYEAQWIASNTEFKKISFIGDTTDYGVEGIASAKETFDEIGGFEFATEDYVDLNGVDFSAVMTKIKDAQPDAVWITLTASAGYATVLQQYAEAGLGGIPLVGRVLSLGNFLPLYEAAGLWGHGVTFYDPRVETPGNADFLARWEAKTGSIDGAIAAYPGYQAGLIIADAVRRAGSSDPSAIRDALVDTDLASLLGGTIQFDDHHQASNKAVMFSFQGQNVEVTGIVPED